MPRHPSIRSTVAMALFAAGGAAWAGTTPMDTKLTEDGATLIECSVRDPRENKGVFTKSGNGAENPQKSAKTDGYHYNLYIPKGYSANPERRYPCLFIASPGGNAGMGAFAERLKRDEWIVVMLQESRNDSPDWLRNFLAAHDDVVERVRIARGAKFATGMSGGARCSSVNVTARPGFAGLLCQAAGFASEFSPDVDPYEKFPARILAAATFGDADSNQFESQRFRRDLKQCRVLVQFFKGGHSTCPAENFDAAMDWMETSLFADAARAKKSGSYAPAPAARPVGMKGGPAQPEILDEEAYRWYYRKCKRLLEESTAKPARALALERLQTVIKQGMLGKDKTIAEETKTWQTELDALHASPEFKEFTQTAQKAFLEAQKAEESFADSMKSGKSEFGKMKFSGSERAALQKAIRSYRTMVEKYPDSPLSTEAKRTLAALEVEVSKAQ